MTSTEYYRSSKKGRAKKAAYDREFNRKPSQVKKRVELNRENRKRGTYGNGDKKDLSHTKRGLKYKPQEVNRGSRTDQPGDRRARGGGKSL